MFKVYCRVTTTSLISAIQAKDTNTQLIIAGANVNQFYNGKTALHYAINGKQVRIIELLIKNSADLGIFDSRNQSSLELIFKKLNQRSVLQLIKSFPAVNQHDHYDGNTALHYATQRNYYDCAAELGAHFMTVVVKSWEHLLQKPPCNKVDQHHF